MAGIIVDKDYICRDYATEIFMISPNRTYNTLLALVTVWCIAIVAAPLLAAGGEVSGPAGSLLYEGFSRICHQIDARSFHIAGEKLGVCVRCSSIYFGFLATLIAIPFIVSPNRLRTPSIQWLFLALAPMIVDVLSYNLGIQSSPVMARLVTGILAGAILPLYIVPSLLEAVGQIKMSLYKAGGFYARKTQ
ncbi:MAG: DUF2085 domain-containing protein [Ignavibacteriales bacterium]|nr:DUF2085 domain-containing protein [Ignavibacteriales bacterium]